MRVVIAWPGFTGYLGPCFGALAKLCDLRVYVEPSKYEQQFDAEGLEGLWWKRVTPDVRPAVEETVREIRAWSPDFVMVCGWGTPLCRAVGRAELGRRNVMAFDMPWEWSFRKIAARWLLAPYLRHFDAAFVPGNRCARYASWLGFRGERLVLGLNSSGWERFGESSDVAVAGRRQGFLFVGRFVPAKGLDVLLSAYTAYRKQSVAAWDLDLVGSGEGLPSMLPEGVRRVGFVAPDDMPRVMREHACLVLPSRWEPWGVCAAEAMSAGLATIVSERCGITDDAQPTCRVPAENASALTEAMVRISGMTDEERVAEGNRARAAVEPFSEKNWAQRVMTLAEEGWNE